MSMLKRLEKEFKEDENSSERENQSTGSSFTDDLFPSHTNDKLSDSFKKNVKDLIDMLQDFYEKKIDTPNATEFDALEYIPLFNINGLLLAALLDVTMEEYYLATDYMVRTLGLDDGEDDA